MTPNTLPQGQPYKLTTKELESNFDLNMYDFGARMQDMQLGRWLQVDPLAEKYYGISPYAFCANNPVKYYDPNGKEIWINFGKKGRVRYDDGKLYNEDGSEYSGKVKGFLKQSMNALNKLSTSKTGNAMVDDMSSSKNVFDIKDAFYNPNKQQNEFVESDNKKAFGEQNKSNPIAKQAYENRGINLSGGSGGTIYWDPSGTALPTTKGEQYSSETDLGHEMAHGYDADRGLMNTENINGLKWNEYSASYRENLIRGELGLPLRTSYGTLTKDAYGNPIEVQVPLLDSQLQPILPA